MAVQYGTNWRIQFQLINKVGDEMIGERDLNTLIGSMSPSLSDKHYVFCTSTEITWEKVSELTPKATFMEEEGLTLVLEEHQAQELMLDYEEVYQCITLNVHSSLEAVGLTAAFATTLTENNISANVIAGYYHDHIFVKKVDALLAQQALEHLAKSYQAT